MPDITDLILDDHETLRRGFAELDEQCDAGTDALSRAWEPLGQFLDLHAAAEEQASYPQLLARGQRAEAEATDAIKDHNAIRDAVGAAQAPVTSGEWWQAVGQAREQNSDHMGEEERGALADFRVSAPGGLRDEVGAQFVSFKQEHVDGRGLRPTDKDPQAYIAEERPWRCP